MPFSEDSRSISFLFQDFSDSHFLWMYAIVRTWSRCSGETDTIRITARQQAGTGSPTNRLCCQEVGKTNAFRRHLVDIRSGISVSSITREITIPHIIQIDQDDIRVIRGYACH